MHTCIPYPNKIHLTIILFTNNKKFLFLDFHHLIKQILLDSLCQKNKLSPDIFKINRGFLCVIKTAIGVYLTSP